MRIEEVLLASSVGEDSRPPTLRDQTARDDHQVGGEL